MIINKMIKKVSTFALLLAVFSTMFLLGGNAITVKADTQIVSMQNIYHDTNDNVNVLFNVDESQLYDYRVYGVVYGTCGKIIVKDVATGKLTEYNAEKMQEGNGSAQFKSVFRHNPGQKVLIELKFSAPSITGHLQDYYNNNNGHWYQCHAWN